MLLPVRGAQASHACTLQCRMPSQRGGYQCPRQFGNYCGVSFGELVASDTNTSDANVKEVVRTVLWRKMISRPFAQVASRT
jgi:hypothetical protein